MYKSFKYRMYPTEPQKELIKKHIGSSRFIYNLALETKIAVYIGNKVNLSPFDLIKQLPELKKECEWLKEVNSQSLQQSIQNMDIAFKRFFKGQSNFPKFKKKISKGNFPIPQNVKINKADSKLIIPKFKEGIKIIIDKEINDKIKSATITKTPTNKYFVSILVDTNIAISKKKEIKVETTIGIDLGIKTFLVDSNSGQYNNPKYLYKAQSKLKYLQRKFSKYKGKRTKQQLVLQHEKIVNKRKDFLHKTSTEIIKSHDSIVIEDLNVKGMIKNHKLAQSITDVSWRTFVTMLGYKADWFGKNLLKIGRFEPSSKTCSNCGSIYKGLELNERNWKCAGCNSIHDRDINAAINIKNIGLKNKLSKGLRLENRNELLTLVGVLTSEAYHN